jgi:radical SAM superfamily enzyme YgiQ (UPF0313 family)
MKKGQTRDDIITANKLTSNHGIKSHFSLLIGFPEDSRETILETIEFIITLDYDQINVTFPIPYPGLPLFDQMKENNLLLSEHPRDYYVGNCLGRTKHLDVDELKELQLIAMKRFKLNKRFIFKKVKTTKIKDVPRITQSFYKILFNKD